jgi:hypothetical protein
MEVKIMAIPQDEVEARRYEKAVYDGEEPTFEKVASFYPPMKYPNAIVGVDGFPGETYVTWNSDVVCPVDDHYPQKVGEGVYLLFAFDYPFVCVGDEGEVKRSLLDDYLPVVRTEWRKGNIFFKSRVFASLMQADVMVNFVRIKLENDGSTSEDVRFWVAVGRVSPGYGPEVGGIKSLTYSQPLSMGDDGTLLETRDGEKRIVCTFDQVGKWHEWYGQNTQVMDIESRNSMLKAHQSLDNVMEYNFNIPPVRCARFAYVFLSIRCPPNMKVTCLQWMKRFIFLNSNLIVSNS